MNRLDEDILKVLNEKQIDYKSIEDEAKVRAGKCFLDYYINNTKDLYDEYNDFGKIWQRENAHQFLYEFLHLDNETIDKVLNQYTYWTKDDWIPNEISRQFVNYAFDVLSFKPNSPEEKLLNDYDNDLIQSDSSENKEAALMRKFIELGYKFIKVV